MTRGSATAQSVNGRRPAPGYPGNFGAVPEDAGVRFRVSAPGTRDLRLHLLTGTSAGTHEPLGNAGGVFEFFVKGACAGDRYGYGLGGSELRPDPASRFQPEGVHKPSEIVDPRAYDWRERHWHGPHPRELVIYELHVGTFTRAGTFAAAQDRLGELRDLGVTAIELMPVADFAGTRNWGYDGACLYAPSRNYGRPDDLRALVDAAHAHGISVMLDVVYNHLGPEGAYLTLFNPDYITSRHETPWGGAVNLDGPGAGLVRGFIIDNAVHWIREYRLDGLRLDATHALVDTSATHVVAELVDAVRSAAPWPVMVFGEDHRNLAVLVEPRERGGWGLDGVWADDFHHVIRRHLAGDSHGYYQDFEGSYEEIARTIHQGWLFAGQHSNYAKACRGTDPSRIPMRKFVVCLQNHDQIGNRATGDRLHHRIDSAAWRAASVLLLTVPMTPLLFMGQEWAASSPFQYFTDLEPELGRLVTAGRRHEFRHFPEFADSASREAIPDPQARGTFERSRLDWGERDRGMHRSILALYAELLRLRRLHAALGASDDLSADSAVLDGGTLLMRREHQGERFSIVARLSAGGDVARFTIPGTGEPQIVLSTEDARFALDPVPPRIDVRPGSASIRFDRPGAVILKS
ncbi:MAG: malto-oligosyltrehalose trehalohydrolase [Vicinamibacterales bacterium]